MMRSRNPGFTLLEVIVASTLSLLVLGVLFTFLTTTLRASTKSSVRVDMEQQSVLGINKMVDDLQHTSASGVSITPADGHTAPVTIGIIREVTVLPDGTKVWDSHVVTWQWDQVGGSLLRKVTDPAALGGQGGGFTLDGFTTPPVPDNVLTALAALTVPDTQTVARDVFQFRVSADRSQADALPVSLDIVLSRQAATGAQGPEQFEYQTTVSVRNKT